MQVGVLIESITSCRFTQLGTFHFHFIRYDLSIVLVTQEYHISFGLNYRKVPNPLLRVIGFPNIGYLESRIFSTDDRRDFEE